MPSRMPSPCGGWARAQAGSARKRTAVTSSESRKRRLPGAKVAATRAARAAMERGAGGWVDVEQAAPAGSVDVPAAPAPAGEGSPPVALAIPAPEMGEVEMAATGAAAGGGGAGRAAGAGVDPGSVSGEGGVRLAVERGVLG